MKTTSYNPEKEIKAGIWIALLTIAIFTTVKVKELQINEKYSDPGIITENISTGFPALPLLDAKLIEEPAAAANSTANKANEKVEKELALQLKSWMDDNAYWSAEANASEQELASQIKSWINDGAYWSTDN